MSEPDVTARVRAFYERYPFPGLRPIDGSGLTVMRRLGRTVTRARGRSIRILDAGCGTGNTLASLARLHAGAEFVGIDLSRASIDAAREACRLLPNVSLRQADLLEPLDHGSFDAILCLGVLHHVSDMARALRHLRSALAVGGEILLWLYGRHGRFRHALNVRFLRFLLEVEPPPEDPVALAREVALDLGGGAALADLLGDTLDAGLRRAMDSDVWLADQFLHPHETAVDMEEILDLAEGSGLRLAEWLEVKGDLSAFGASPAILERFRLLDARRAHLALDAWLKPDHYLVSLAIA